MLIKIKNSISEIEKVCDQVKSFCSENGISDEKYHDIVLILDEIVTNVINYAYPPEEEHVFALSITKDNEYIYIKLIDAGIAFNPLSIEDPDVASSIEDRAIGGLGIFLVRQLSEFVEYSRVDNKNHLDIKVAVCNREENYGTENCQ